MQRDDHSPGSSATPETPCPRRARPWILAATILGSSMAFIDGTVVNVALPAIQQNFTASVTAMTWVVNAYTLFLAALILPGGSAGDLFGRRLVFSTGVVAFALASVLCGYAPDVETLIAARALQGVGGALLIPGSLSIITAFYAPAERGKAIGLWAGASAITTALGPPLGGWLIEAISWRWIFFINIPLAIITLWITLRNMPESRSKTPRRIDVPGALLAVIGLGSFVLGLTTSARTRDAGWDVALLLGGGALVFALFLFVEFRSTSPMMPLHLFRSGNFRGANLLTLFLYFSLSGVFFFLPFLLIQVQGYTHFQAGMAFIPFPLLMFLLSRWSGSLVSSYGAKLPLVVGPLVAAAGCLLFGLMGPAGAGPADYWSTVFPAMILMSAGMAVSVAPLTTTVMNAVDDDDAGAASGVNNAVSRIAGLKAVAVLGAVALLIYPVELRDRLSALEAAWGVAVPPAVYEHLLREQDRMAATQIPDDFALDESRRVAIRGAINGAFLKSYRVAMFIAAALAFLSAACAAVMIRGREEETKRE